MDPHLFNKFIVWNYKALKLVEDFSIPSLGPKVYARRMLTYYSICWHSNWSKAIRQASRYGWFIFSIFQLNSQCQSDQCWRKFATLAIFYKYLVILLGLVSIWQHFEYTLAIFFLGVGQNFIVVKVQILKNDLTIWSHCSKCLKGICFKVAFTLRQIKLRKMFDFCWIFFTLLA